MKPLLTLLACAALTACTQFPELEAAVSDRAKASDYPKLILAERLAQERTGPSRLGQEDGPALLARAQRLKARGAILRGLPTIDESTRLRISARLKALGG